MIHLNVGLLLNTKHLCCKGGRGNAGNPSGSTLRQLHILVT